MTPTLIDITMITGLDVTSSANPMSLNTKNQFDSRTKSIGGWSGYVAAYMCKGPVTSREHVAFLLMWLEKFLFCGSSCGPTTNWQFLTEALETKRQFPLGKILLGAGGPWWLLQTWLNLIAMKAVNRPSVTEVEFPRLEPITYDDGEERTHRRCMSYGEFASTPTDAGAKLSAEWLKDWFCSFYEGFHKDARLPIGLFFADKIQCRGEISSTLMMDRLLNIPGPPLGSIENIELARFRSRNFDRWWGELKQHIFHQSASMYMTDLFPDVVPQTTESSPPHKSNSGRDIEYAPGLLPNGGGLAPLVISYHAPKTSSLLQGQMRDPADVSRKSKTKAPAIDPSALAPKKKAKKPKPKPTDDLPTLDASIEQALDEEEIEEYVDQAAAELSDTGEKTPSASPKQTPPTPAAPAHFSRKKKTVVRNKSATTTLKPAPSALADLFSFDIKDYFDETEEDTTSKALAPLSDDVNRTLQDISHRLEASSLDNLVVDCGSIRTWLHEIQSQIPDELADVVTPSVYLEQHQFKLEKAKQRLADRRERKDIEATIQINQQLVHEEKSKLDLLSEGPIKSNIDRLEARKIELIAQLEECNAELNLEQKKLADLPKVIEEQKSRLKSAIRNVPDMTKSLKIIPGTDAQDAQAIEEVEQIRQRVVLAIQQYLSQ
uniref:Putative myosin heavy chain n=1 Tax=Oryza sativa subsp. japonica TaxID=39947 RepID=Q6UUS8_ORYSJ|nr:putative myosin heavy chain [Oryza sativa Japonica Group]